MQQTTMFEHGLCLNCGNDCNFHSQLCGICMRATMLNDINMICNAPVDKSHIQHIIEPTKDVQTKPSKIQPSKKHLEKKSKNE